MIVATICVLLLAQAAPQPAPMVQGRLRTTIIVEERPYYDPLTGEILLRRRAPIIQDILLDARPGIEGVTIAVDAWTAIDAGERSLAEPALADVTEAWIRWHVDMATMRAGRLFLFLPGSRGMRIDGAHVKLHPKWAPLGVRLHADLWGGLVVTPSYGDEALRTSRPRVPGSALDLAPGGSDWLRPGDWTAGGILGASFGGYVEAEAGYLMVRDLGDVDREAVVARLSIVPLDTVRIDGYGSFDLYAGAVEEADVSARFWFIPDARATVYGRMRRPDLLLPSTSIFSVFGGAAHSELGLEIDLWPQSRYRVAVSGGARLTDVVGFDDRALGGVGEASVRGPIPGWEAARALVSWRYVGDDYNGSYHLARLGLELPITSWAGASLDGGATWVDFDDVEGVALGGGASAHVRLGAGWSAVLSLRGSDRPDAIRDLALIGRVEWNAVRDL